MTRQCEAAARVGVGNGHLPREAAEKIGGTAVARLPTSGEKKAVIDVGGLGLDADGAARVGVGAALRSWRHDRYRTKLQDKQKPTLEEVVIVGGGEGPSQRYRSRWAPVVRGRFTDPRARHRASQHHLPRDVCRTRRARRLKARVLEVEVLDRAEMEKLGMGALLGVAQGSAREAPPSRPEMERRRRGR